MSGRVRHTTPRTHRSRHQEAEADSGTPRRSARPYDYASAVSPGRHAAVRDPIDRKGHRDGSARSPRPAANGYQYPGDAALRRQSTQRPGARRGSIDPDQYRRPSPVRRVDVSPVRSPRRERDIPFGDVRESTSRHRHRRDDSATATDTRTSSRRPHHRSRSRPDSALRTHRYGRDDGHQSAKSRPESRHRSRSRRTRDESSHRRSHSHRRDREVDAAAATVPSLASRQNTGRYISPLDTRGRGGAGASVPSAPVTTSASSGHRSGRRYESGRPVSPLRPSHYVDPLPLTTSSRPPAPRPAREPRPTYDYGAAVSGGGGSHALSPPTLASPQRQRSGSHIEVLSVSSLNRPSLASLAGPGSEMYVQTPLSAPHQRTRGGRPFVSPSPDQPCDMLGDRIEETREWMAELKQQVARDKAMERAEAAIAAADVDRFLAQLRRTDSITAPSEFDEPQRLYWRATSPASATATAPLTSSRRERTRPAAENAAGFRSAPRGTRESTPERRHHSTRRRDRDAGSSRVDQSRDEPPTQRSRSGHKGRSSSAKKKSRDRPSDREERPRPSSTRRRRGEDAAGVTEVAEEPLTASRATSAHPPPPGVPASRTMSQTAWQTAPVVTTPQTFEEENIVDIVATPTSTDEAASACAPGPAAATATSSRPSQPHSRQSSGQPSYTTEGRHKMEGGEGEDAKRKNDAAPHDNRATSAKKKSSKPRPPTPSDNATTASETALETEDSPVPRPAPPPEEDASVDAVARDKAADDPSVEQGEEEDDDVYFLSFMDGTRFLSTDELCQYNVFMAESLSDANLDLLREVVFNQDDVHFAEVLYGDDIQAELAQIEALFRDAARRNARPLAEVEDEIWVDQRAAIKRFNNKAAVALEGVRSCGTDFVEALESAAIAYREQQASNK